MANVGDHRHKFAPVGFEFQLKGSAQPSIRLSGFPKKMFALRLQCSAGCILSGMSFFRIDSARKELVLGYAALLLGLTLFSTVS